MPAIELELTKTIEQNAARCFESAKKAKKKLEGARKALKETEQKLEALKKEELSFQKEEQQRELYATQKRQKKKEWYEKFHWFISSEGFLCIGGKDATSNEIIIKKHLDKEDLVFHTDMAGSPFFIVKNGQKAGEQTKQETAIATAAYSKAWKLGHTTADVFYVLPEQVTKEAQSGEYLQKGSFMIRGKTHYLHPKMEYAIGLFEGEIIGGPAEAVRTKTSTYIIVIPGDEAKGSLAKKVRHQLGGGELDDIIKFLPAGGAKVKKER